LNQSISSLILARFFGSLWIGGRSDLVGDIFKIAELSLKRKPSSSSTGTWRLGLTAGVAGLHLRAFEEVDEVDLERRAAFGREQQDGTARGWKSDRRRVS